MNLQNLIFDTVKNFSPLAFILVFLGAALLSLGSCTIIRIPIVLGYVTGLSVSRRDSVITLLGFSLGLTLSYTLLGVLFGIGAKFITVAVNVSTVFYLVAGILLLLIGLYLLGFIPKFSPGHLKCNAPKTKFKKMNFFTAFAFGIAFAFFEAPLCPCCGPLLLMLASIVFIKGKIIYALLIFLAYAIGQSLPIFIIGLSAGTLKFANQKLHLIEPYIQAISGALLFCAGIYLLWMA
ncbi:MAG: hypothetical protein GY858_00645 [Candidatus Omnitrophica bacterium]|nr:hypothetical protein [Candidatus Omnitrophota bacterium]